MSSSLPIGNVSELAPDDKYPGTYLKSTVEIGSSTGTQYLLVVGATSAADSEAVAAGAFAPDEDVVDILTDTDALYYAGANGEGYRMLMRALTVGGVRLKYAAADITGGGQATATITIDFTSISETGSIFYRLGGRPVGPIGIGLADTPETVANAIAAFINADPVFCASATVAAGLSTEYVVTLTAGSYGARGNQLLIWQDDSLVPAGFTSTLGSGTVGGTVASSTGPFALAHGDTLVVAFNAGGDQTFTISATSAARETTNSESTPFALSDGMTLTVKIDGGATQTVTFHTANFVDITNATAEEVALVIDNQLTGASASATSGGTKVTITSDRKGTGSHVQVTGGTANAVGALNFSTTVANGSGNVSNVAAVTAAEWVTIMSAITNGTAVDDGGKLRLTSTTTGSSGTVLVKAASTADTKMGFDNATHVGSTGGSTATSGAMYFSGGSGTENVNPLLTNLQTQEYFTVAAAQRDSTNMGRWETAENAKLNPLVGLLENVVMATVGTLSASGSLAQTTLNHSSFEVLWLEESETPGEELAALWAATRHQLEIQHPNQRYDLVPLPTVQPQEAKSKQPSRATSVAALNYGLTPIEVRNNTAVLVRAVTSRTQTDLGGNDDGTVDVAMWRTALEFRRALKQMLDDHMVQHPYIVDDPAEGDEPDVPTTTTYPRNIAIQTWNLEYKKQADDWLAQVAQNPPKCALHPTAATPRPILYAPIVVKPLLHQIAGTVALRKFNVAVSS